MLEPDAAELAELIQLAREARWRAYAPYSRFRVGAAVLARDGRRFSGANVENASYGLTLCAERTAVAQAVFAGVRELSAVVIATGTSPPAAPCGTCRQTLIEFAADCLVVLVNDAGEERRARLADLLPMSFGPADLGVHPEAGEDHGPR
jgi:cytidine deaminase